MGFAFQPWQAVFAVITLVALTNPHAAAKQSAIH
jgi:hypothetical protein